MPLTMTGPTFPPATPGGVTFDGPTLEGASPIAGDFLEALAAWLETHPTILANYPGGWAFGGASRDDVFPFGEHVKFETKRLNLTKPGAAIEHVTIHFHSLATDAGTAERLAETLKSIILPSASYTSPPKLVFAGGIEVSRYSAGEEVTGLDPSRGPLNSDVFRSLVPVTWILARG